jgi:hypothetical protein
VAVGTGTGGLVACSCDGLGSATLTGT